jgi:hypothetical protein
LNIVQEFEIAVGLQRISDIQTIDSLVNPKLSAGNAHAFHAEDSCAMRLRLLHTRVSTLIPGIAGITGWRVCGFDPPPSSFIGELHHGDGA